MNDGKSVDELREDADKAKTEGSDKAAKLEEVADKKEEVEKAEKEATDET